MIDRTTTVGDVMTMAPHTIGRDQTLSSAHRMFGDHGIRHLPVLAGGTLVGIVSDRDVRLVESIRSVDPELTTVEDAMTPEPFTAVPQDPLSTVATTMAQHRYGAAVVVDGGRVVGIFTAIDALRLLAQLIAEKK